MQMRIFEHNNHSTDRTPWKSTTGPLRGDVMGKVSKFLVIAAEIAGLSFALRREEGPGHHHHQEGGLRVGTNTRRGGSPTVWSDEDTFESTSRIPQGGGGLCHADTVDFVVRTPRGIRDLISGSPVHPADRQEGVRPPPARGDTRPGGSPREGPTGREVERALLLRAGRIPRSGSSRTIRRSTSSRGQKLSSSTTRGRRGARRLRLDRTTVRSTLRGGRDGPRHRGSGKVYCKQQPRRRHGDGVPGYRAGATIANMEFVQFHPTCLYHPLAKSFLISGLSRGEGATS